MHHEDIKAAIRKKGVTPADLARTLEVSAQVVSKVIRGIDKSEPIASAIARITGLPLSTLWPGKYEPQVSGQQRAAQLLGRTASKRRKAA